MIRLGKRQSRTGALAIFVAAVSLLAWAVIYPLVSHYIALGASIEEKRFQVAQYQRLAADHDELRNGLAQLRKRSHTKVYNVAGATAALASANMQKQLKRIVTSTGGELISTQLVARGGEEQRSAAVLQVHIKADIATLLQVFYRLENGQPMYFLDDVAINARPLRSAAQAATAANTLDVRFSLTGYLEEPA